MIDPRLLAHLVDGEGDTVRLTFGLDDRLDGLIAVERKAHRDDGLQRIALRAAGR